MGLIKYPNLRKFSSRIYLLIVTAFFLLVLAFSTTLYFNIQRIVLDNEHKNNKSLLYQLKYNMDYMEEMLRNFCQYIYYYPDTKVVMYYKGIDNEYPDIMKNMGRLQDIANMTYFLKSIYVYNHYEKAYYSTDNGIFSDKSMLDDVVGQYKEIPRMKLILRKLAPNEKDSNSISKHVFSLFLYESLDDTKIMNGGVIFNIKPEWIFSNVKMLNNEDKTASVKFLILNSDTGEFIEEKPSESSFSDEVGKYYNMYSKNTSESYDSFTCTVNAQKYLVSYIKVGKTNWVIIKMQSYNEIIKYVGLLQRCIILITLVFLGFVFVVALSVSKGIYKPIGKLVKKVGNDQINNKYLYGTDDEIMYLENAYDYSLQQVNLYRQEKNNNRDIVKSYFVRKLIIESFSFSRSEIVKICNDAGMLINPEKKTMVLVVKVDDYNNLRLKNSESNQSLYKFAIINIMTEVLSEKFAGEAVDMKEDEIVFILNVGTETNNVITDIQQLIIRAQEYISKHFMLSMSVSISEIIHDISMLTDVYKKTRDYLAYRLIFGKMCIIQPQMVKENQDNRQADYPAYLKKKLSEQLKSGNMQEVENTILNILKEISRFNYNNIMSCLMQLVNDIKSVIDELNQMKLETARLNMNLIIQQIFEAETMDELLGKIMDAIKECLSKDSSSKNEKYIIMVETVKSIIDKNYTDSNLCLQEIAPMLKVSAPYMGRIFKDITQTSVAEYINEVRMSHAIELMKSSHESINQIIARVGMENETYFYKVFKKKYGTTPKEYILKDTVLKN